VAFIYVLMAISIGVSAYLQGRREGTWSWRRFFVWVGLLVVGGGGVGLVAALLGKQAGPGSAAPIAFGAAAIIIAGVFILAYRFRPGRRRKD
jgi:hypothetical protein